MLFVDAVDQRKHQGALRSRIQCRRPRSHTRGGTDSSIRHETEALSSSRRIAIGTNRPQRRGHDEMTGLHDLAQFIQTID